MNDEINLFRLTDDVRQEVLKALNFWTRFSLVKNAVLSQRAANDLTNRYTSISKLEKTSIENSTQSNPKEFTEVIQNHLALIDKMIVGSAKEFVPILELIRSNFLSAIAQPAGVKE